MSVDVITWAEATWIVPETRKLIVLKDWQRTFLLAAFPPDGSPSQWETFLISAPKKSGKTTLNSIGTLYAAMTRPGPETVFCVANDLQQSQDRVFTRLVTQLRLSGAVKRGEASVGKSEIVLRESGTRITALAADAPGAA